MSVPLPLYAAAAARAAGGEWIGRPPDMLGSFAFDSRIMRAGQVFVAVCARRDGHVFVANAASKGAQAAVVSRAVDHSLPMLIVDDTVAALGRLARERRINFAGKVVAITGSNGKTTVRAMLEGILREWAGDKAVLASQDSWNNHLGLPATLLGISTSNEYVVLEAGMSKAGELTALGQTAIPDISVLTNVGRAHCGNFNSPQEVAEAKGELLAQTAKNGTCVLNRDDPGFEIWKKIAAPRRMVSFSVSGANDAHFSRAAGRNFSVTYLGERISCELRAPGRHNEANALAAVAAASVLGVDADAVAAGLEKFAGVRGRLRVNELPDGGTIIDDTYNASPESVLCAIEVLAERPEKRKIMVLGDMLELGGDAQRLHAEMCAQALSRGIGDVLTFGRLSAGSGGRHFLSKDELIAVVRGMVGADCAVLVKGSRAMRMEDVVKHAGGAG